MFSAFLAAINEELAKMNAYTSVLDGGEKRVAEHKAPPRMMLFPASDSFGPANGPGGNPRPIGSVQEGYVLIIHGAQRDHVQGMRDQFYAALRAACKRTSVFGPRGGGYQVSKGEWRTAQHLATKGFEYRLIFSIEAAIVERRWEPLQAPDASTYEGPQAQTYPTVPGEELEIRADVGIEDGDPGNVPIVVRDDA